MPYQQIRQSIISAIAKRGSSIREVARLSGVTDRTLRRLLSDDDNNPTIDTLDTLADHLGIEIVAKRKRKR